MSEDAVIDLERRDTVAVITIRNPARRNAFTRDMRKDLTAKLSDLMSEPAVRAIVLRGAGSHFCSGADMSARKSHQWTFIEHRENNRDINRLAQLLAGAPKPVIAAVEGAAVGAGMGIACACDVIIAGDTAKFIPLFTRLGLVPEIGILYTLAQRVGASRAKRILMASTPVDAPTAFKIGLVDEMVAAGGSFDRALEVAQEFNECVPLAVAVTKEAFAHGVPSLNEAGRIEMDWVPMLVRTEDASEGFAAGRDKRKPKFTGN